MRYSKVATPIREHQDTLTTWPPRSEPPRHGTDWRGLSLVLGAIGVIGSSVIVPIVLRQPVTDVSSLATKADVAELTKKVDALAGTVGSAWIAADGTSSQLRGVLERLDAVEKKKKPKAAP